MKLLALFWIFFRLGLVSFGSVFAVLPELQRALVDQGLITPEGFVQAFVLGQVVPGPAMAMCAVIGWKVAGLAGALVAFVGIYSGPVAIMGGAYAVYHRWRDVTWVRRLELAVRPVVLGLLAGLRGLAPLDDGGDAAPAGARRGRASWGCWRRPDGSGRSR